jgi:hypothetical protein
MNKPADDNREENQAQAQSDATPDAVASGVREDAVPEFDEVEGEERKRLYKKTGSPIVSKID